VVERDMIKTRAGKMNPFSIEAKPPKKSPRRNAMRKMKLLLFRRR
jgi:hypothetical protein